MSQDILVHPSVQEAIELIDQYEILVKQHEYALAILEEIRRFERRWPHMDDDPDWVDRRHAAESAYDHWTVALYHFAERAKRGV